MTETVLTNLFHKCSTDSYQLLNWACHLWPLPLWCIFSHSSSSLPSSSNRALSEHRSAHKTMLPYHDTVLRNDVNKWRLWRKQTGSEYKAHRHTTTTTTTTTTGRVLLMMIMMKMGIIIIIIIRCKQTACCARRLGIPQTMRNSCARDCLLLVCRAWASPMYVCMFCTTQTSLLCASHRRIIAFFFVGSAAIALLDEALLALVVSHKFEINLLRRSCVCVTPLKPPPPSPPPLPLSTQHRSNERTRSCTVRSCAVFCLTSKRAVDVRFSSVWTVCTIGSKITHTHTHTHIRPANVSNWWTQRTPISGQ